MNIEIISFASYQKNTTLQGFLAIRLTESGLEIKDIALHKKNGNRWLQLPAKPYKKLDGGKGWSYILNFHKKEHFNKFQEVTLKALDAFQLQDKGNKRNAEPNRF